MPIGYFLNTACMVLQCLFAYLSWLYIYIFLVTVCFIVENVAQGYSNKVYLSDIPVINYFGKPKNTYIVIKFTKSLLHYYKKKNLID